MESGQKIQDTLFELIKSNITCILVSTVETSRALRLIQDTAQGAEWPCYECHIGQDVIRTDQALANTEIDVVQQCRSLPEALDFIDGKDAKTRTLFVIPDMQLFFNDPNPANRNRIKVLIKRAEYLRKTIIFVSHVAITDIPVELHNFIVAIDLPMPKEDDMGAIFKEFEPNARKKKLVKMTKADKKNFLVNSQGLTVNQMIFYLRRHLATQTPLTKDSVFEIAEEKKDIIERVRTLQVMQPVSLDDLGGLENLKTWLLKRKDLFSDKAREFGISPPKGILMAGFQGTGKSLAAKTVSSVFNIPLVRFDLAMTRDKFVGASEQIMSRSLKILDAVSPCVVYIDEVEKTLQTSVIGSESSLHVLSQLLTWMQEDNKSFIVATSNNVDHLPSELIRKGRFDEIFYVDLPHTFERETIFSIHIRKTGRDSSKYATDIYASLTDSFTGAEIEQVIKDALIDAFDTGGDLIDNHIIGQIQQTTPRAVSQKERIDALRASLLESKLARPASQPSQKQSVTPTTPAHVIEGLGAFNQIGEA